MTSRVLMYSWGSPTYGCLGYDTNDSVVATPRLITCLAEADIGDDIVVERFGCAQLSSYCVLRNRPFYHLSDADLQDDKIELLRALEVLSS